MNVHTERNMPAHTSLCVKKQHRLCQSDIVTKIKTQLYTHRKYSSLRMEFSVSYYDCPLQMAGGVRLSEIQEPTSDATVSGSTCILQPLQHCQQLINCLYQVLKLMHH